MLCGLELRQEAGGALFTKHLLRHGKVVTLFQVDVLIDTTGLAAS